MKPKLYIVWCRRLFGTFDTRLRIRGKARYILVPKLMLENTQTALHNTVLQYGAWGNVDCAAFSCNDDDSTLQCHVATQVHCTSDGKMIQLDDTRDAGNVLLEVGHLLEVGSELDDGNTAESVGVHD